MVHYELLKNTKIIQENKILGVAVEWYVASLNYSVINYCCFSYYSLCCFLFSVPVK